MKCTYCGAEDDFVFVEFVKRTLPIIEVTIRGEDTDLRVGEESVEGMSTDPYIQCTKCSAELLFPTPYWSMI